MIINQDANLVVPEKTIAFFPSPIKENEKKFTNNLSIKEVNLFLNPLSLDHKREWFSSNFYRCLPLSIGNMQGFVVSLPYTLSVSWNGGNKVDDVSMYVYDDYKPFEDKHLIYPTLEFGHGIFTIHLPINLKTPPGVNLMTISPPNFPLTGLSPMTGVIESDNLRFSFTLNVRINLIDTLITIIPNTPIIGILPIPRYFCDSFELKDAFDIFNKKTVQDEIDVVQKHNILRDFNNPRSQIDGLYYAGKDIDLNKFKDHQLPKKIKKEKK